MQDGQFSHHQLLALADILASDQIFRELQGRVEMADRAFGPPTVTRAFPLQRRLPQLRYDDEWDEAALCNLKALQKYGALPDGRSAVLAYLESFRDLSSEQTREALQRLNLF